ncbi:MAG: tRNA (5-methylaminomethyl-2-thiouridine)(34)-methyltransferase MnmD [Cryomorphaceae bacterium]|nr:tRNA (5-methylaminomethyl-2-thiouridine)(34)-methyltransferase MnmD [Cryomorphaceae bacterium]
MTNKLVITNDGSHSIFNPEVNETYHSKHGAIVEAEYVFIKNGLLAENKKQFSILEVGFGTGLNALLTAQKAQQKKIDINYHGIELYPVPKESYIQLNFTELIGEEKSKLLNLHECNWEEEHVINKFFKLTKNEIALEKYTSKTKFDIIYFDAFSPEKQPELWTAEVFQNIYDLLKEDGFLVTYCAKGVVKRTMKTVGFEIIVLDGPPGKRQMTRANKTTSQK